MTHSVGRKGNCQRWLIFRVLLLLLTPLFAVSGVRAAEEPRTELSGKITLYASFLDMEDGLAAGLFRVDPATDTWTKLENRPIRNGVEPMSYIRVSPDGTRVAFNRWTNTQDGRAEWNSVWLQQLEPGAKERKISDIHGRPVWSPDGAHLLVVEIKSDADSRAPGRYTTWKLGLDGSQPVRLPLLELDEVWDCSRDGRWVLVLGLHPDRNRGQSLVITQADNTQRRTLKGPGDLFYPRISPDGKRVAYLHVLREGKGIWIQDVDGTPARRVYLEHDDAFIDHVVWSPDGHHLAAVLLTWDRNEKGERTMGGKTMGSPRLCIINADTGELRRLSHPAARVMGDPEWR